ncbi:MAG TPA: hypothetical protein VGY58_21720 [Gemmataceae bacterium]|jgi:hypothetical protein|nr:hypothetical protein [Gemmataceae bacterium]
MATNKRSTLVAIFKDRGHAEMAIDALHHEGFADEEIGILTPHGELSEATTPTERSEDNAADGAVAGAVTGGVTGAVAGALVATLLPGIGAVLAGGILTAAVLGGAAGAAGGSYLGPFLAMGFSREEVTAYEQHLRSGCTIVAVRPGERFNDAVQVLREHGGEVKTLLRQEAGVR